MYYFLFYIRPLELFLNYYELYNSLSYLMYLFNELLQFVCKYYFVILSFKNIYILN